jgi:RNA polymerase sigma-70 factor, ECF subfamily
VSYALTISSYRAPDGPNSGSAAAEAPVVAAARDGNRDALESLLRQHYDRCYALCRRLLGDDEDALDAAQEAMIAIARGISAFDGRSAFSTWVYRVTTNAAFDELRRRRRRPAGDQWGDLSSDAGEESLYHGGPVDSDEVGDAVTARMTLDQALGRLSAEHRTAVVLRDMLDLEYAEIADVLLVPIGTVRSRLARGRAALADVLSSERAASAPPTRGESANSERPPAPPGGAPEAASARGTLRLGNSEAPGSVKSPGPRL